MDLTANQEQVNASIAQETSTEINSRNTGEPEEHELEVVDYSGFNKEQFAVYFKELTKEADVKKADNDIRNAKPFLDDLREKERETALEKFVAEGGDKEDFVRKPDPLDILIDGSIRLVRDKKIKFAREQEMERNQNLYKKKDILDRLRILVDSEDNKSGFHQFKQLQEEWKQVGAVPPSEIKTLWANYNALIDRFYDHRNIYFELKELDRKKNLEAKQELITKAEKLADVADIALAVKELNDLHNEFKHVGPVPLEQKEALWAKFKAASDAVYSRRDAHVKELNEKLNTNLETKNKLMAELVSLANTTTDKIKEWNEVTKRVLAIQKEWGEVGPVPRAKAKDLNKLFWHTFKSFFNTKGLFFKKLDDERQGNLNLKKGLIEKVNAMKGSADWEKTANEIKKLQLEWKEIGPVPDRVREKVYQEFKEACDHFFNERRHSFEKVDREQEDNLKQKEAVCATLQTMAAEHSATREQVLELVNQFNAIGFVPKNTVNSIRDKFNAQLEAAIQQANLDVESKDKLHVEISLQSLKTDPEAARKIHQREQAIRKKISQTENDLAVLRNNLEFFARSKNAEKVKADFNVKINQADIELRQLKVQLKMLKAAS